MQIVDDVQQVSFAIQGQIVLRTVPFVFRNAMLLNRQVLRSINTIVATQLLPRFGKITAQLLKAM